VRRTSILAASRACSSARSRLVLCFALAASAGSWLPAQDEPSSDADALEKELKDAMAGQQFEAAASIAVRLLAAGGAKAVDAIVQNALTGASYAVEKAVGGALAASTDPADSKPRSTWPARSSTATT